MAIDCQHSWYRRPPPSRALSPDTAAGSNLGDSVPVSTPAELPTKIAEPNDTSTPPQADPVDSVS